MLLNGFKRLLASVIEAGPVMAEILVAMHDVSSAQRLIDMARLVYGLGLKQFIATKLYGAAASSGVPDVMRLALRLNRGFYVLPHVRDAVEAFNPGKVIIVSHDYGELLPISEIVARLSNEEKVLLVFGGSEAAPGKDIAGLGEAVYPAGLEARIGPVAEAAIILYPLIASLPKSS